MPARPFVFVVIAAAVAFGGAADLRAQRSPHPEVVAAVSTADLSGDWFEVASTGSFALRRCLSDTRHSFERQSARTLQVRTVCITGRGVERRRGFLEGSKSGDGRYSLRYAPLVLSWAPAAWSDFWILSLADEGWMLVGDRQRRSFAVLSRVVALDEGALARAIATARRLGYAPDALHLTAHPAGASGLLARP